MRVNKTYIGVILIILVMLGFYVKNYRSGKLAGFDEVKNAKSMNGEWTTNQKAMHNYQSRDF